MILYTEASLTQKQNKGKDLESSRIRQAACTRANGRTIKGTVGVMNYSTTATFTRASIRLANHMARGSIPGRTERCTMANGQEESNTDTVSGREFKMNRILVSGTTTKLKVSVFTRGRMVTDMKESGTAISGMDLAMTSSLMVTNIEANTTLASHMAQGLTSGPTDLSTKANSKMD